MPQKQRVSATCEQYEPSEFIPVTIFHMPSGTDAMAVLAAAVTPVVLVSATAILISGVNARYIAISDRTRALAQECRTASCTPERRAVIRVQLGIFQKRLSLVAWAVRSLYAGTACFVSMPMLISATAYRRMLISTTLPLFGLGIILILVSIFCELVELQLSNRTIALEVRDVTAE